MTWQDFLSEEIKQDYYKNLMRFIKSEYENHICHPDVENIWNALKTTSYEDTKVVILGQDPYHNYNEAHGLSFSVLCSKLPPSLKNIYKEMESDLNLKIEQDGDLTYLAKQGVLLLNTILTVRHNSPLSHKNKGWEKLTDRIIELLNKKTTPVCFVLWGNNARMKESMITNPIHLVIKSVHPSPLSAHNGFFGSKPFSKINNFLEKNNLEIIRWKK